MPPNPRTTIALCTYNGAEHLEEQLASFEAQTHTNWDLWASDDGSRDDTLAILERFKEKHQQERRVHIIQGPGQGAATNFLSLLCHADFPVDTIVALADQDDVWLPVKLQRAVEALAEVGQLSLYGGRSQHTDAELNVTGLSILSQRAPSFSNALTQNIVSGHSAAFSPASLAVVRQAGVPSGIPFHDWWLYQLISGAGGDIVIDHTPVVYYRQHGTNVHGAHEGLSAQIERIRKILSKTYGCWLRDNREALWESRALLHPDQRLLLEALRNAPAAGPARLKAFRTLGLYRQSMSGTALLYFAALLGLV